MRQAVVNLLTNGVDLVWKNACQQPAGRRAFRWDLLIDRRPGAPPPGEARVDAQYFRANVSDSERFVLTVPGSSQYRVPANDPNEFSNCISRVIGLNARSTRVAWRRRRFGDALQPGDLRLSAAVSISGVDF